MANPTRPSDDFSAEDDTEAHKTFGNLANCEFKRLNERLKYQKRKDTVLYLRSLGKDERKRLRAKYNEPKATSRK